ncbi:MAG: rhomboid family intramembrane serine protease [Bdellovibrionaceae bacterium]|nr:rhomboid family intramembrane serine protease [Pseudobdellovibrionaceae bacterium]
MRGQVQFSVPFSPVVKKLVIINVAVWIGLILILQQLVLDKPLVFAWFSLIPSKAMGDFFIWQPFTYMFLHSPNSVFHILFNMLLLWMFGSELEQRWGSQFFLIYYLVCGVGAGILYMFAIYIYYFISGDVSPLFTPVVGASGAVFGLLLAYGMVFGERMVYFMMLFPMKAKFFVMIIGGVELVTLLSSGVKGEVANLAHLGGLISGFIFLYTWVRFKNKLIKNFTKKRGRKLKLVVNNDEDESKDDGPKYWN